MLPSKRDVPDSVPQIGDAARDFMYTQQRAAEYGENDDESDPFYLKPFKALDRLAMELAGLIPNHVLSADELPLARDRDYPLLPGVARTEPSHQG
jgi:hypothetical protein